MSDDLLELSERIWTGQSEAAAHHWFAHFGEIATPLPDTVHVAAFSNVNAIATDDGMVVGDTSSPVGSAKAHASSSGPRCSGSPRRARTSPSTTSAPIRGVIDVRGIRSTASAESAASAQRPWSRSSRAREASR